MQVQSAQNGQVAVTWTDTSTFTAQVTISASSIKAGDCLTAVAPSGTDASATAFTATTVSVTQPVNGSCSGGFGGAGARPTGSGFPTGAPRSGYPSGARPSGSGATRQFGTVASGSVVSVSGSTIVVAARDFGARQRAGASATASPSPTTTDKTVSVAATTTISATQSATASAVVVGKCATVRGTADSSGAVTATSVAITTPTNGQCGAGRFGRAAGAAPTSGATP